MTQTNSLRVFSPFNAIKCGVKNRKFQNFAGKYFSANINLFTYFFGSQYVSLF